MRRLKNFTKLPDALSAEVDLVSKLSPFKIAVFLDYDGTLTPLRPHPEEALLGEDVREAVHALSKRATVSIVSGRDKEDIQKRVALPGLYYAGNHGFDVEGPAQSAIRFQVGVEVAPQMENCVHELRQRLKVISGVHFEPKKLTITIHYRHVEEKNVSRVFDLMHQTVKNYPTLKISAGKQVLEIRPNVDWDKGKAVQCLMEKLNFNVSDYYIIYIGDDLSDEDAFRILPAQAAGILVGSHSNETYADYCLQDPQQVKNFLEALTHRKRSRG